MQIGAGIWCGLAFIIAGILTISPGSPTILPLRKVMLIISIIFAVFLAFWTFSGAFIHAVIDTFDPFDDEYNENRLLRVIQGFCAVFKIVLAGVTFCQRTSEQEGQVTTAPQILVTVQQGVQLNKCETDPYFLQNFQCTTMFIYELCKISELNTEHEIVLFSAMFTS